MAHSGHHELASHRDGDRTHARAIIGLLALTAIVVVAAAIGTSARPAAGALRAGHPVAENRIDSVGSTPAIRQVPAVGFTMRMTEQEQLVAAVVTDIADFWSSRLPTVSGISASPLRGGITAVDSAAASGSAPCVGRPSDITGNAYYCPSDDGIVYDASALIPVVLDRYGIGGLISTFAHEYGHAIEARLDDAGVAGGDDLAASNAPLTRLTSEARADCSAGAFVAWALAGKTTHIEISDDVLLSAVRPLIDFADQETVSPTDPTAHGLAVDRLGWFIGGYRHGAAQCLTLSGRSAAQRSDTDPESATLEPRFATNADLLTAARLSIGDFARAEGAVLPAVPTDPDMLPAAVARAAPYGQFAQATVVALRLGGYFSGGAAERQAAACFAGSWVRSVYSSAPADRLGGWPGDVDEGLYGVLSQPHADFTTLAGYLDGLHGEHRDEDIRSRCA